MDLTVGIVLLAMIALFVGLRLYAVLGQRTGHEQRPVTRPEATPGPEPTAAPAEAKTASASRAASPSSRSRRRHPRHHLRRFRLRRRAFLEGAQGAYRMVLEAFWKGDREELAVLVTDEVRAAFEAAIAEREARATSSRTGWWRSSAPRSRMPGSTGRTAEIDVRFDAFVVAVTRDAEGELVAGSLSDAIPTHDVWTFRRKLGSEDPNWLLVDTDEAA